MRASRDARKSRFQLVNAPLSWTDVTIAIPHKRFLSAVPGFEDWAVPGGKD
jgi:hypothetical protein